VRLLVFGHWSHTGFGVVTNRIASGLVERGVDVRVLAGNHRGEPIKGTLAGRVWPLEALGQYIRHVPANAIAGKLWPTLDPKDNWKPDAVLVIADVSGLLNFVGKAVEPWQQVPVYHYCPIEGDNLPPLWRSLWSLFRPVAMSTYGASVIAEHIDNAVPMIYHGVDTDTFHPASASTPLATTDRVLRSKEGCKELFGWDPQRKVILRADRNVVRKNYDAMLAAFTTIAERDPDVDLVLHCDPRDPEGIDLNQEIMRMPEGLRERVRFTQMHDTFQGLPEAELCALYNAADLYMSTTGGEGFGLTLAESLACGVPVIATGWAAEVEVIGPGGVLIPPLTDSYGDPVRYHSKFGMDWAAPDPRAFVEPALELLARPSRRRALGAEGRAHVQRSFNWDEATVAFLDLFTEALAQPEPVAA
jgi:glycosyltransferase involved in cell wall biosynthesis